MSERTQNEIDQQNREFWDELCGTQLAQSLGVHDFSPESLAKFDRYYLETYPYLKRYLALDQLRDKDVMEVGLGYGTVAQLLAGHARSYCGLDIAAGPVTMVNRRMELFKLPGSAQQGSILAAPFPDSSFDAVVTIGCLHHTGDLAGALNEVHRVLRPGGTAMVMVYNALSYRRWWNAPRAAWQAWRDPNLLHATERRATDRDRGAYDRSSAGTSAPETVFTSVRQMQRLCSQFREVRIDKENAEQEPPFSKFRRHSLLPIVGPAMGLDLYASLRK